LYIPLGGNREGVGRTYANLMVTMLIGGLWHGASWLFIIWGGLHGIFLCFERVIKKSKISESTLWNNTVIKIGLSLLTFIMVCIAWVFFRSADLSKAFGIISSMFGAHSFQINGDMYIRKEDFLTVAITAISMFIIHWNLRNTSIENLFAKLPLPVKSIIITILAYCIIISFGGEDRAFIYFQF
jgi:D-alanyl-lipoteichoic acid acyltransferase DltB (MBOAT superfamily)